MRKTLRILRSVPVMLLAAAIAAVTAACGSSAISDPLAGLTSKQIAAKAVAGTEAAPSVRVTGSGSDSGQPVSLDMTLVRGKGCQGSLTEGKYGTFKLVYDGATVWMLPDSKFYKASGVPAAAAAVLDGKYLKLKASGSGLGSLADVCSLPALLSQFAVDAGTAKGVVTTLGGQRAVRITDRSSTGKAYVSDTASPELLQIDKPGSGGGQINLSYTGNPGTITPPPASQTIDGSKYGF